MIDVETENLMSLAEATRHRAFVRDGKPLHVATVYRLITRGLIGTTGERVILESFKGPCGRRTSREAIVRFVARLSGHAPDQRPAPSAWRKLDADAAERDAAAVLDAAGIR